MFSSRSSAARRLNAWLRLGAVKIVHVCQVHAHVRSGLVAARRLGRLSALVVLQVVILHGRWRGRPVHHARVGALHRLLEEDLLPEVRDALPRRAPRVRLLSSLALVALYLSQDRLLAHRLARVVVHAPALAAHALGEARVLRRVQRIRREARGVVRRVVDAVVSAVHGRRRVNQVQSARVVR